MFLSNLSNHHSERFKVLSCLQFVFDSVFECFEESLVLLKIFNNFKPASLWIFEQCQLNNYVDLFDERKSSASGLFPKETTNKSRVMCGKY